MGSSRLSRRAVLKTAALGSAAVITAPYVSGVHAAGTLSLGCWDHWVPGANKTLDKICKEWGEKNKVDVHIDYITSQGEKDKLTAAAEAQAGTGHDIMSHRDWNIRIHERLLEPLNDVADQLIKQYGPISPVAEYLAKIKGTWRGIPTAIGSQVKPCQSRFDLYKEHCGIDLVDMFPADESKYDKAKTDLWTWDLYLETAQKLHKAGYPVGLPMGQTSDAVDWVGALFKSFGVVMIDEKDNIKINSDETRTVMEYLKKLMAVNPPEVYAWDDAGNNRWIISGKGSGIMNPPSSWAVAKRDNPKVAENIWLHSMPKGPKGVSSDSFRNSTACGASRRTNRRARISCSICRKRNRWPNWSPPRSATTCPPSRACTTSTPGRPSSRRRAWCTATRRVATSKPRCSAHLRARKSAPKCTIRRSTP